MTLTEYITEAFKIGKLTYEGLLEQLKDNKKFKPVEDAKGDWYTEAGEYDFHAVDDSYKFNIFTRATGGRMGMVNRYLYGPDSKNDESKTVMVSGEYTGGIPNHLTVAMVHFDKRGNLDYYKLMNLMPNGEYSYTPTYNTMDFSRLEEELSGIIK